MILKSLTRRNNTGQLLKYLFNPNKNEKTEPVLKHNLRTRSQDGWKKEFEVNNALRIRKRKDNIQIYHTVLSFSNKDKEFINKALLKDISKKYVELRGKENIFLSVSHHDRDHVHLHIIQSATKYLTGESNRISKKEFHELKLALDAYQKEKYPELVHSLPDHGKSLPLQRTEIEHQLQNREGKLSHKQQVIQSMETVYEKSKSLDQFLVQLKSEGYNAYYRGGKLYGIEDTDGRHYRFKTLDYADKLDSLQKQAEMEEKELQTLSDLRESKSNEREEEYEREIEAESEKTEDVENNTI